MTIRQYYHDSYRLAFSGTGLTQTLFNEQPAVILPETWFYPTSGGQPHDTGLINDVVVKEVIATGDGTIVHLMEGPVPEGDFESSIDGNRRRQFRQQHTGQHILSRAFELVGGLETLSSTLGETQNTIDLPLEGFSESMAADAEGLANQIVNEARMVAVHLVSESDLSRFDLRKQPTVDGTIRLIDISGFDVTPCGGTHCRQTSEVGPVKLLRSEKMKSDRIRLSFLCGDRALADYHSKSRLLRDLSVIVSATGDELTERIRQLTDSEKALRKELGQYRKRLNLLEAAALANELPVQGFIIRSLDGKSPEDLSVMASYLAEKTRSAGFLYSVGRGIDGILYTSSDNIPDIREILPIIKEQFGLRGGGSRSVVQFSIPGPAEPSQVELLIRQWFNQRNHQ